MKKFVLIMTLLFGCFGAAFLVQAEDKSASGHSAFPYDSAQQVTISGKIQEVKEYQCPVSGTVGAHITVKSDSGTMEVHLAPVTFLKDYEITLRAGDEVKVVGAKIVVEGKPALMARTVAVGDTVFTFRDPNGKPLW